MRGGIQKKGNNYYAIVYDGIDPGTGKKRRRWVAAGIRRADAEKVLNAEIKRKYDGEPVPTEKLTVGEYLTQRWLPIQKSRVRASTYDSYRRNIDLRDLSSPHQFQRVAGAMAELGQVDAALRWARRGIAETSGWQVAKLYDLAGELLTDAEDLDAVVELRRHHHERMPSASSYAKLKVAAGAIDAWDTEVARARAVLAERDSVGYLDALLADGEADEAFAVATAKGHETRASQWLCLAEAREPDEPGDAMAVYLRLADEVLGRADQRSYRDAVRHLKAARRAATAADRTDELTEYVGGLRERNRRRPSFIAMLDKAGLR